MATLNVGDKVHGGTIPEDFDCGRVVAVDGDQVTVAWESGVTTTQPADLLESQ